jgi:hypothetical protein
MEYDSLSCPLATGIGTECSGIRRIGVFVGSGSLELGCKPLFLLYELLGYHPEGRKTANSKDEKLSHSTAEKSCGERG